MKNLYALLITVFALTSAANARIVTSIANGNATNPLTWNCTCIPVDGDTIMINHAVTLDVDYAFTMGGIQVNATGSVTGNANNRIFGVSGGYFLNNGTVTIAYIYHNGGTFVNNGTLTATRNMGIDLAVTNINNGTLAANDTFLLNTNAAFLNYGMFDAPEIGTVGTFTNTGIITCDNILNMGTFTHFAGSMNVAVSFYNTGTVTLSAPTMISGDIWNAENFTVNTYLYIARLVNGDSLQGTATFTNNSTISIVNGLYNSETLNGSGSFCVSDSTVNTGAVNGTLDICDQTGTGWDFNIGTEAGTVTHCAAGPCTIGIPEVPLVSMTMVPNPANELLNVTFSKPQTGIVRVTDVTGRVVIEQEVNGNSVLLNVVTLPVGIYSVTVVGAEQVSNGRFVKQ